MSQNFAGAKKSVFGGFHPHDVVQAATRLTMWFDRGMVNLLGSSYVDGDQFQEDCQLVWNYRGRLINQATAQDDVALLNEIQIKWENSTGFARWIVVSNMIATQYFDQFDELERAANP